MIIRVSDMKYNQTGTVVQISGGHGLEKRLDTMGIRPGTLIRKKSAQFLRGPVTIGVARSELALGHGMAQKITVEVTE